MTRNWGEQARKLAWLAMRLLGTLSVLGACDSGDSSGLGQVEAGLRGVSGSVLVEIDLSRGVGERPASMGLFGSSQPAALAELVLAIRDASRQRATRGFFLRFGGQGVSLAQAEELSRLLSSLSEDQPVTCHAHGYSNVTLLLASVGCDDVWLSPAGEVSSVGIASQTLYLKRLLDRLEVRTDFLHVGKYKSAIEGLTRDGPSEAARESLLGVLGSVRESWLESIGEARAGERVLHAAEHGPWTPGEARDNGLIDHVGYESQARDAAKRSTGASEIETVAGAEKRRSAADQLAQVLRSLSGASSNGADDARIVLLPTAGGIRMAAGGPFGDGGIAARPLMKTLRRLTKDDSVKAVVLRIDSPGGSALASDLLWHELMALRAKKPLIATLAATAASGGYYMACAANQIVAERTSIVGSIGVFGGKIVVGQTLDQLGVSGVTLAASTEEGAAARAAYLSPLIEWDAATRARVRSHMRHIYDLFLSRVSTGRELPVERLQEVAQGRIWSGVQGQRLGLVDELGGVQQAIALARDAAGLDDDVPVQIERGPETLLALLGLGEDADEDAVARALGYLRSRPPELFAGLSRPLWPHVESLTALLGEERVVAAMPFALQVR